MVEKICGKGESVSIFCTTVKEQSSTIFDKTNRTEKNGRRRKWRESLKELGA